MAYRIIDLGVFVGLPTGNELAEVSDNGNGSFKLPIAELAYGRIANNVTTAGTTTISAIEFGDVLVNCNGLVTIQFPPASTRFGVPISVVDIGGFANTQNITILPDGSETLIGQSSLVISSAYGGYTLWPIVTGGWYTK